MGSTRALPRDYFLRPPVRQGARNLPFPFRKAPFLRDTLVARKLQPAEIEKFIIIWAVSKTPWRLRY
jgi:hypothetical protein